MTTQKRVHLELTEAQRAQIKAETGQEPESLDVELAVEELEERSAPGRMKAAPVNVTPVDL
jgi:hypothetical protein